MGEVGTTRSRGEGGGDNGLIPPTSILPRKRLCRDVIARE
jgi:hypothetical protein